MKYQLKSIRTWSAVKLTFVMSLVLGFVFGLVYVAFLAPFFILGIQAGSVFGGGMEPGEGVAVIILIGLPFAMAFISAFFNTIMVAIAVPFYNLLGRTIGGLELDVEEMPGLHGSPPASPPTNDRGYPTPPPPPAGGSPTTRPQPGDSGPETPSSELPPVEKDREDDKPQQP